MSDLQTVQFTLQPSAGSGSLLLGRCQRKTGIVGSESNVLSLGKTTFGVSSKASAKCLVRKRAPGMGSNPFASISMALPFASTTAASKPVAKSATDTAAKPKKTFQEVVEYASKRALSGGIPGMVAMGLQVLTLMWLRTTINYQYRYGTTTLVALKTLWAEGGIPRFYSGLAPALIQGPLSRFGDTAANTGVLAVLEDADMPPALKTVAASMGAAVFRIALMPVDACKTIMQVEGKNGMAALANKIKLGGPGVLFHGALAASAATFVGHYPWFAMYNTLNATLPVYTELQPRLLRSAFIGWCSSFVSDCCSNSIRVVKTAKQTSTVPVTYQGIVKDIIAKEGVAGLFTRGLGTKLVTNGIQGILFSVLWRLGQDYMEKKEKDEKDAAAEIAAATTSKKK